MKDSFDKELDQLLKATGAQFRDSARELLETGEFQRRRSEQISRAIVGTSGSSKPAGLRTFLAAVFSRPILLGAAGAAAFALTLALVGDKNVSRQVPRQIAQTSAEAADSAYIQLAMADAYSEFREDFSAEADELLTGDPLSFDIESFAPEETPTFVDSSEYFTEEETSDDTTIEWL